MNPQYLKFLEDVYASGMDPKTAALFRSLVHSGPSVIDFSQHPRHGPIIFDNQGNIVPHEEVIDTTGRVVNKELLELPEGECD